MNEANDKNLKRFWYESKRNIGVGITAYSRDDADQILKAAIERHQLDIEVVNVIEDININELDEGHVRPNMNPPNFRGVWFPMLNENLRTDWV